MNRRAIFNIRIAFIKSVKNHLLYNSGTYTIRHYNRGLKHVKFGIIFTFNNDSICEIGKRNTI